MGKYQLDYKGMQQVERYHEKNATVKNDKKARVQALLKKAGKKKYYDLTPTKSNR